MPEPRLIADYFACFSARLPARIADELADGLDQAYRGHRERGLDQDAAARAAIAEFGDQDLIVAGFTAASPARQAARRLLITGPGAGLCWGAALITARAWRWPVPVAGRAACGAALLLIIGLLAAAALGRNYRPVIRAATAGCLGMTLLDLTAISLASASISSLNWPVAAAITASALRLAYTLRHLQRTAAAAG